MHHCVSSLPSLIKITVQHYERHTHTIAGVHMGSACTVIIIRLPPEGHEGRLVIHRGGLVANHIGSWQSQWVTSLGQQPGLIYCAVHPCPSPLFYNHSRTHSCGRDAEHGMESCTCDERQCRQDKDVMCESMRLSEKKEVQSSLDQTSCLGGVTMTIW